MSRASKIETRRVDRDVKQSSLIRLELIRSRPVDLTATHTSNQSLTTRGWDPVKSASLYNKTVVLRHLGLESWQFLHDGIIHS